MKISELREKLKKIQEEYGDLDVIAETISGEEYIEIDKVSKGGMYVHRVCSNRYNREEVNKEEAGIYAMLS